MSQVVNIILEEFTVGWLEFQVVLPEALKHNVHSMLVFLFHL